MYPLRTLFQTHLVKPRGIIYTGAHVGEFLGAFLDTGFESVLCLEPNPEDFAQLERNASTRVRCLNVAVSDHDGVTPYFMVPGVPTLNSTFEPDRDYWTRLEGGELVTRNMPMRLEVKSLRLDTILEQHGLSGQYNVLYMNIQGGELRALQGAPRTLESIDTVFTEANFERRYTGCAVFEEVDAFLRAAGFRLMYLEKFPSSAGEHGDALYRRISSMPKAGIEALNELEER